jgi:hypothetical protein
MRDIHKSFLVSSTLVLAILLPLDSIPDAAKSSGFSTDAVARYENLARTYEVVFAGGYGTGGEILALRPTSEQKRAFREKLGYAVHGCSDANFRCIAYLYSVFAVPRQPLSPGMTYTAGGAQLRVEECIRGSGESCQVALISSDCQIAMKSGRCQLMPNGGSKDSVPGPVTYFVFNEDIGITAFGKAGGWITSPDERLQTAKDVVTQLILQGKVGLLKVEVTTVP